MYLYLILLPLYQIIYINVLYIKSHLQFSLYKRNNRWRSQRNLQFLALLLLDTLQQLWVEAEVTSYCEQTDEMKATRERTEKEVAG